MRETNRQRRIPQRIGAVVAGMVVTIILSIVTDAFLHATGVFPPPGEPLAGALFVLVTAYRQLYGLGGSYLTARLAPDRPMLHAMVLGGVGLGASVAGVMATWNRGPEFGPRWYPLALVALALPCAWAGGKLAELRRQRNSREEVAGAHL